MATDQLIRTGVTLAMLHHLCGARHGLAVWCPSCRRWGDLDLARLVMEGHGARPVLGLRARCGVCGGRGALQLRPPVPPWPGAVMYLRSPCVGER